MQVRDLQINKIQIGWGAALLQLLIFSTITIGQHQYYDSPSFDDKITDFTYYDSTNNVYRLIGFQDKAGPTSDTNFSYYQISLQNNLNFGSRSTIRIPVSAGFNPGILKAADSEGKKLIISEINPSKSHSYFVPSFLSKFYLSNHKAGGISNSIQITPDSCYGAEINAQWTIPNNDTLYIIISYSSGKSDSTISEHLIKIDTSTSTVTHELIKIRSLNNQILLRSNPVLLPNGHLVFTGIKEISQGSFGGFLFETSPLLDTVYKTRPMNSPMKVHGTWVLGSKVVVFGMGGRYDPSLPFSLSNENVLEVFDLSKDTISTKYFFPFNSIQNLSNGSSSGPGSYFNGEYFILASTINDSTRNSPSKDFKTVLFAVDTSFTIINNIVINDSSKTYLGSIQTILADPDTADSFIYFGHLYSPQLTSSPDYDLMWGRFKVKKSDISIPEIEFRKAEVYFYPNPSSTYVDILVNSERQKSYQLEFYTQNGQKVFEAEVYSGKTRLNHTLSSGVYTVVATTTGLCEVMSLVVQ